MNRTTIRKRQVPARAKLRMSENHNGNGTGPKRARDQAGKKRALIQAALGLFATKGYEVTTTREIAASAGCAEGLIHRYFNGKAGLLSAMLDYRIAKEVLDFSHQPRPASNFADEFLRLVDREVERVWESRDFLRVFIPRAIVDPSVGSVMNKALISVRARAIMERLKHYDSCVPLPQDAIEAFTQAVGMLGLVFGFVRPVLLGHDLHGAKKMAVTVAKILVDNLAVSSAI